MVKVNIELEWDSIPQTLRGKVESTNGIRASRVRQFSTVELSWRGEEIVQAAMQVMGRDLLAAVQRA